MTVHPFASLASRVPDNCPRVLINLDKVGDFGTRPDDVVLLGKTDEEVRRLCRSLRWEEDLDQLWKETENVGVEIAKSPEEKPVVQEESATQEQLKEAVDRITDKVGVSLEGEATEVKAPPKIDEVAVEKEIDVLSAAMERTLSVADPPPSQEKPHTEKDHVSAESQSGEEARDSSKGVKGASAGKL